MDVSIDINFNAINESPNEVSFKAIVVALCYLINEG